MLKLRTGTPGSGKTLSVIDELRHIKDRSIYYHGIPELSPDLGWIYIDDPLDYPNQITDGSIFVLDECQKHFPVRAPKDKVPAAVSFIETHRHRGIDLYFITQHPALLDHHARRLVGHHTHLQRNFGMAFAAMYTNNKLFDYGNYHELQQCEKTTYRYSKDVFNLYKSAEVHTHKPKFPKKLLLVPLLLAMVGGGVYIVWSMLHKNHAVGMTSPVPVYQKDTHQGTDMGKASPLDWTTAFVPKIPGLPYTAPFYKDLAKPVVMPLVAGCVASSKKCQCYTQQATKIDMSDDLCRLTVKNKVFNPFQEKPVEAFARTTQPVNDHSNSPTSTAASHYQPLPPPIFTAPDEHVPMYVDVPASKL